MRGEGGCTRGWLLQCFGIGHVASHIHIYLDHVLFGLFSYSFKQLTIPLAGLLFLLPLAD